MTRKRWTRSRTLWIAALQILLGVATLLAASYGLIAQVVPAEVAALIVIASGIVQAALRVVTKTTVCLADPDKPCDLGGPDALG